MRAKVAKMLRLSVYGEDGSPRARDYSLIRLGAKGRREALILDAGRARAVYQRVKQAYHEAPAAIRARCHAKPHYLVGAVTGRHLGRSA